MSRDTDAHAYITLPKDPKDVEEAMTMADWPEWLTAVKKKLKNFNIHESLREADQVGHAMKTKIILKYVVCCVVILKSREWTTRRPSLLRQPAW
jgi:hypothetical protein